MNWFESYLEQSLADDRLSRKESKALKHLLEQHGPDLSRIAELRAQLFDFLQANTALDAEAKLAAAERVIKTLAAWTERAHATTAAVETLFFPGRTEHERLCELVSRIKRSADICVFTITDDRVVDRLLDKAKAGAKIRVISDNDKSLDRGSDIERMQRGGIRCVLDQSEHHMHHKFALFDDNLVLTGSYNWTRSAANHNRENLLITDDPRIYADFRKEFDRLWKAFGG